MKVNITIVSMYQNKISIHSVISLSLTQTISDLMLVVGRCRDIAHKASFKFKMHSTACVTIFKCHIISRPKKQNANV